MYSQRPNLILGFHGCDQWVRDQLIADPNNNKISKFIPRKKVKWAF